MDDDKILLLHRNTSTLEKLSKSLRNSGYSTILASKPEEAFTLAKNLKPDIVIWGDELNLHNQEIIRKLKNVNSEKSISIIALYDNAELYDRIVAQHYGIDDFLPLNAKYEEIKSKIHFVRSFKETLKIHHSKVIKYKNLSETNFNLMTSQDIGNACEIMAQYLIDSYPIQFFILNVYNSSINDFDYFNVVYPKNENEIQIDTIQHHEIWNEYFFHHKVMDTEEITDKKINKIFHDWNFEFDKVFQFPLQYKGSFVGMLLISFIPGKQLDSEEGRILASLSQAVAFRLTEIRRRFRVRRQEEGKYYKVEDLFQRPTESEVYLLLSQRLVRVLRADLCLYMNYNEGFRFLYPKYLFKGDDERNLFEKEKPPVLLIKDLPTFDNLLETRNPLVINIPNDKSHTDLKKLPGFKDYKLTNIFIYPVAVANAMQGFFVLGEESILKQYTMREIQYCGKLIENATKALEENQILKDAKMLVKQMERIFALSTELTLDFPLIDILKRISTAIRRTLGWNIVILDKKNNYSNRFETINVLGLEPANYKKLMKKEKFPLFKNKLDNSYAISQSYFYDHSHADVVKKEKDLKHFVLQIGTEWNDRDWIFIPIKSRGKLLGMISVNDPVDRRRPSEERIKSIEYFANQAAVVMENAELFDRLKSSELKYRMLAETMTMGLVTCDIKGKIQYINSSLIRMLKYTLAKELINKKIYDLCTSNSAHKLEKVIVKILKNQVEPSDINEDARGVEIDLNGNGGEKIPFMIYLSPYYQQKQIVGFFGVLSDLRAQKKIERLKADFNSMIVHDLRSPLNIIQGYVDIVRTQVVGKISEEQAELLSIAKENVYKVLKLIDNFLIASKLDTGQYNIELETGSVNDLIDTIYEHHQVLADRKKIKLEKILDENIPLLNFDKFRLEQVISNLLSNALKFTPKNGTVSVSTRLKKGKRVLTGEADMFAEVSVKDTGIGISKGEIEKVFNKYEQTEAGKNAALKGTGLGLAIAREIIELHKGEIWVESEKNKGSNFYFTLPIIPQKL